MNDKKLGVSSPSNSSLIDHFEPQVVSAQDYYPFGMLQVGRSYNAAGYRYGFNGKENDNEVKGEGSQLDFGARIYDPRTGRFFSVDPLTENYPWYSPYLYAGDMPISCIDVEGMGPDPGPLTAVRTTPKVNIKIDIDLLNGRSGGIQLPNAPQPPSATPPSPNIWVKLADAGIEAIQAYRYYKNMSDYIEYQEKIAYQKLNTQSVQMRTKHQILSGYEQHNNQDHSQLSDQYLAEVEKRINSGTASDQDRQYQNEITRRKLLIADPMTDGSTGRSRQLIGEAYEDYLVKVLGGTGGFSAKSATAGRQFDGSYGNNIWYEAKGGDFFGKGFTQKNFEKFKSDIGRGLNVAKANNATYEIFSENSIPDNVKQWLENKGIKYHENFKEKK